MEDWEINIIFIIGLSFLMGTLVQKLVDSTVIWNSPIGLLDIGIIILDACVIISNYMSIKKQIEG